MITTQNLMYIKKVQKEYKSLFGEELLVDFPTMKGAVPDEERREITTALITYATAAGITLEHLRGICLSSPQYHKEREVILNFVREVRDKKWNQRIAGELLNRDRTIIPYYIKKLAS